MYVPVRIVYVTMWSYISSSYSNALKAKWKPDVWGEIMVKVVTDKLNCFFIDSHQDGMNLDHTVFCQSAPPVLKLR